MMAALKPPGIVAVNGGRRRYDDGVADIVLTTLNARYAHASFALRYLMANLPDDLRSRAAILEFDVSQRSVDVLEKILAQAPKIVGVGVYIWNAEESARLVADLKRVSPQTIVILGGPEISYETDQQTIARDADFVITGEGDLAFAGLCQKLLKGTRPLQRTIAADLPEFSALRLPYDLYNDDDLAHRVVYVEASRGCPFKCEFCLSSLDVPVRNVPLDGFLGHMQRLLDRGLRQFKFVDRTFNLNLNVSRSILQFFRDRYEPGLFLHFEMIPDRLPEALRETIARFPAGALQFEVGVQTFNEDVAARISRRQDNAKLADNLMFLREKTGVHVHADLIVGLPGEDITSFGRGFDRLVALRPQEIQVGMLKRLRGTPIVRHDVEWEMVYSPHAPYEVLKTKVIDFSTMQRLRRLARYWDLIANSGNFVATTPMLWEGEAGRPGSPFEEFLKLSDWLFDRTGRRHGIALQQLVGLMFEYLTTRQKKDAAAVGRALGEDYQRGGRSDVPAALKPYVSCKSRRVVSPSSPSIPSRQSRHLQPTKSE
jgi:radical SAM superfamily enzyme YgiQ (UPF0313 family)